MSLEIISEDEEAQNHNSVETYFVLSIPWHSDEVFFLAIFSFTNWILLLTIIKFKFTSTKSRYTK